MDDWGDTRPRGGAYAHTRGDARNARFARRAGEIAICVNRRRLPAYAPTTTLRLYHFLALLGMPATICLPPYRIYRATRKIVGRHIAVISVMGVSDGDSPRHVRRIGALRLLLHPTCRPTHIQQRAPAARWWTPSPACAATTLTAATLPCQHCHLSGSSWLPLTQSSDEQRFGVTSFYHRATTTAHIPADITSRAATTASYPLVPSGNIL